MITKWILRWLIANNWDKYNVSKHQLESIERGERIEELKKLQERPAPLPCLLGRHERFKVPDDLVNSYCTGCGHHLKPVRGTWVTDKEYALLSRRE